MLSVIFEQTKILFLIYPRGLKHWISGIVFLIAWCPSVCAHETHFCSAGAELSRMKRMRDGGAQQWGAMQGMRLSYDFIRPASWYVGGDYFYGQANMEGHSGAQRPIASVITDSIIEGRLGYTFQNTGGRHYFFSLFGGYGVFEERNSFAPPTPLQVTFTDIFAYIPVGFLSAVQLCPIWSMGVNFKAMFMLDGRSYVTDDPVNGDNTLIMTNEVNVRIEFPLYSSAPCTPICFALVPFAEFRHFGGREGFPFDFIDTKFNLIGGRITLMTAF